MGTIENATFEVTSSFLRVGNIRRCSRSELHLNGRKPFAMDTIEIGSQYLTLLKTGW